MPFALTSAADQGTLAALIERVFTELEPSSKGYLDKLAADIDVATDTLVVTYDKGAAIVANAYLCIDVEVFYVWDYNPATKTATVQRGMLGSVPAAHAAGALVQIQPRVSNFDVLTKLREDIRSWPPDLYRTVPTTVAVGTVARGYDLDIPTGYRVLEVTYTPTASSRPLVVQGWRFDDNADVSLYPSGKALIFPYAFGPTTATVVYAAPFVTEPWTAATTVNSIGLWDSLLEIPVLGAAARLVREAPRTDTRAQGQSRLADEVPPMHLANASKDLFRKRDDRIHAEIRRLREVNHLHRA